MLNQLKTFASENLALEREAYEQECTNSFEKHSAVTVAQMDRVYITCHTSFMARVRLQLTSQLQMKATLLYSHLI